MRILAITNNFPNEGNWNHGVFAARQLVEMQNQGNEIKVLVPAVWAPALIRIFLVFVMASEQIAKFYMPTSDLETTVHYDEDSLM